MISYICLSLFIILVYVSGSKLNSIDIPSSQFITKDIVRRTSFNDNTTITATTKTTTTTFTTLAISTTQSSVTIGQQLSARARASSSGTISTIPTNFIVKKDHYNSLHLSKSSSSPASASASSTSTSTPSTVLVSSTLSNIESPSTYFPLPIELPTTTNTRTATATTTTTAAAAAAAAAAASAADGAAQTISNVGYINITSQAGTHVYLPCNVKQLVDRPISWIRIRDGHILTVDQTTFIADERFQSVYTDNPDRRWSLLIKYVQPRDSGSYECQVSTEPKMSARIHLNVIEPKTELLGESIRHVKAGSRVILRCIVSGGLEPPLYINWYFNKKQIILNNRNSWIIELNNHTLNGINTSHSYNTNNDLKPNTIASLIIPSVTKKDSGNYTCSPSNSESITIVLHVLNGEYSASAITSGCSSNNIFHHKNLHNNHHLHVYQHHHHQHHHHNHHLHHLHHVNRHHNYQHHLPNHHIKNHHYYSYYYHYYYQFYYKYYYNHSIIIILLLLHHLHHVLFNDNKIKYNNLIKIFIILFLFQFIFYNNNYYNTKLLRM